MVSEESIPPPADEETEQPVTEVWDEGSEQILVPVSAVEHYSYCPRQCALIYIEQIFEENVFTIRSREVHERVDEGEDTTLGDVRVIRSMPLWSARLGLTGKADVVELRPQGPYPVEYKPGRRHGRHADVQLCAQALCLEEMLGQPVPRGAIYYYATRSRHEVALDSRLRELTMRLIAEVRALLRSQAMPPPLNDARCPNCAQLEVCMPAVLAEPARLRGLQSTLFTVYDDEQDDSKGTQA